MEKILVVEDDLAFGAMIQTWLRKKGFGVEKCTSVKAAIHAWEEAEEGAKADEGGTKTGEGSFSLVLSDLRLPDHDGLFLLQWLRRHQASVPFIVMTSYAEIQNVVLAMKQGATDYVAKPFHPDILLEKIQEAIRGKENAMEKGNEKATEHAKAKGQGEPTTPRYIEGESEASRQLYSFVRLVAPTPMSVLILGASGTGKEYVAHRIHELSQRATGPFVALDCGAIPRDVAASEFFGHAKGAFTGADQDKKGAFEMANGGTLFLDEMGNLGYDVQVQLLRALQERKIRPLGSNREISIDIRLVCATNENLAQCVAEGRFREDLYHRINEFTIHMPQLRDRGNDLLLFANLFIRHANQELGRQVEGLDDQACERIVSYGWPGNLRELNNVMKRATLLATGDRIGLRELEMSMPTMQPSQVSIQQVHPSMQQQYPSPQLSSQPFCSPAPLRDEQTEQQRIEAALRAAGGNKSKAAQLLEVDRKTLYNKMKKYGI